MILRNHNEVRVSASHHTAGNVALFGVEKNRPAIPRHLQGLFEGTSLSIAPDICSQSFSAKAAGVPILDPDYEIDLGRSGGTRVERVADSIAVVFPDETLLYSSVNGRFQRIGALTVGRVQSVYSTGNLLVRRTNGDRWTPAKFEEFGVANAQLVAGEKYELPNDHRVVAIDGAKRIVRSGPELLARWWSASVSNGSVSMTEIVGQSANVRYCMKRFSVFGGEGHFVLHRGKLYFGCPRLNGSGTLYDSDGNGFVPQGAAASDDFGSTLIASSRFLVAGDTRRVAINATTTVNDSHFFLLELQDANWTQLLEISKSQFDEQGDHGARPVSLSDQLLAVKLYPIVSRKFAQVLALASLGAERYMLRSDADVRDLIVVENAAIAFALAGRNKLQIYRIP